MQPDLTKCLKYACGQVCLHKPEIIPSGSTDKKILFVATFTKGFIVHVKGMMYLEDEQINLVYTMYDKVYMKKFRYDAMK
jgi:hypothetical protein